LGTIHGHISNFIIGISIDNNIDRASLLDNTVIENCVTFIEVRGYDLNGAWNKKVSFHSNLYGTENHSWKCIDDTITTLISRGMNNHKIILGVPLYGHGYLSASDVGNTVKETQDASYHIPIKYLPIGNEVYDASVGAAYCVPPGMDAVITYECKESLVTKFEYIKEKLLGGICLNHIACDSLVTDTSLLHHVSMLMMETIKKEQNILNYSSSQYCNIVGNV
jgi:chitinase